VAVVRAGILSASDAEPAEVLDALGLALDAEAWLQKRSQTAIPEAISRNALASWSRSRNDIALGPHACAPRRSRGLEREAFWKRRLESESATEVFGSNRRAGSSTRYVPTMVEPA
jgi:hypothetical protein